jgi:hypothetical protein
MAALIAMLPNLAFLAILFVVVRYAALLRLFLAIEHGTVTFAGFGGSGPNPRFVLHCAFWWWRSASS